MESSTLPDHSNWACSYSGGNASVREEEVVLYLCTTSCAFWILVSSDSLHVHLHLHSLDQTPSEEAADALVLVGLPDCREISKNNSRGGEMATSVPAMPKGAPKPTATRQC